MKYISRPATTIFFLIAISLSFIFFSAYHFYKNIFRLTEKEFKTSLKYIPSDCQKISKCTLEPGDILIRRYITSKTWIMDKLIHPYFTHSAIYLGQDQIAEAVGTEKNPEDDIKISEFSKSDWLDEEIGSWIILRPRKIFGKFDSIKQNLINIAEDPNYIFGLAKIGQKVTSCADLIFQQLKKEDIIRVSNSPEIITPDYLFWLALQMPDDFKIIGYR